MRPKRCAKCGLLKASYCFHARHCYCKPCHNATARASHRRLYAENPERFRQMDREWKRANLAQRLAYNAQWKRRTREARREEAA